MGPADFSSKMNGLTVVLMPRKLRDMYSARYLAAINGTHVSCQATAVLGSTVTADSAQFVIVNPRVVRGRVIGVLRNASAANGTHQS
jgi:hypothetical protein